MACTSLKLAVHRCFVKLIEEDPERLALLGFEVEPVDLKDGGGSKLYWRDGLNGQSVLAATAYRDVGEISCYALTLLHRTRRCVSAERKEAMLLAELDHRMQEGLRIKSVLHGDRRLASVQTHS